jgi:cytochrome oxidase assembly protein ShyY1
VLKRGEARGRFSPDPERWRGGQTQRFFWLNASAMAESLGVASSASGVAAELFVDAVPDVSTVPEEANDVGVDGSSGSWWPFGGTKRASESVFGPDGYIPVRKPLEAHMDFYVTRTTHATYSATWFTLSACGALLTFLKFRR